MNHPKNEIFGIDRTTLLVLAAAITFGSFSVYKALGGGSTKLSGTALAAGVDVTVTNTNPLASAMRLTSATRSPVKTDLTPIEQIQVGDRVLAESPTGEEDTSFGSEIIPSDWRKLTLRAPKRDGTTAEVVLLRPLRWLKEQHGEVGGTVFISVPECGIDGNANVLAIEPCPEIPSGGGRVVTGTFCIQAQSTIELRISGEPQPIGCTGNHPFWSEDRQEYVRADSLQPGEKLRTATGLTTVEFWSLNPRQTHVYNFEVHGAHVYHVGMSGVLVHNDCGFATVWGSRKHLAIEVVDGNGNVIRSHVWGTGADSVISDATNWMYDVSKKDFREQVTISLDAVAAMSFQNKVLGKPFPYITGISDCVTHVRDVLSAGGVGIDSLPTTVDGFLDALRLLGGK